VSTVSAIYKLTNYILRALNNKEKSGGIFFNIEKAFDCVGHNNLLAKMRYYGVIRVMYSLTDSFLRNRYQRVRFNNKLSNWGKINTRIMQISIFRSLLFFIYVNDLPSFIQSAAASNISVVLFTDDTSIIKNELNFTHLERKLTTVLRLMNEWFKLNMFSLNCNKTCSMQFTTITILIIN
jgi:hypothetical protein